MELRTIVRTAAVKKDINGVMDMAKACGLSYERTSRVWCGSKEAKLKDVETVLDALDIQIKFISKGAI